MLDVTRTVFFTCRARRRALRALCVVGALGAAAAAGCGLVSSDVADFDLSLPDKRFSIDIASWQVDAAEVQVALGTSCAAAPTVCSTAAQRACAANCSGSCNASQRCDLRLDVGLYQAVSLLTEKPELRSIDDQPLIKVTIDSVTYDVVSNTLNVATPELGVYVAPMSVMDPRSSEATQIGVIPPVGPGATVSAAALQLTPAGKSKLVSIMSTYKTPFNLLVGSALTVTQGTAIPMGKLDAVVRVRARAGI